MYGAEILKHFFFDIQCLWICDADIVEIEFSYNSDVIKEKTLDQINTINQQVAANQAGFRAATKNADIYK